MHLWGIDLGGTKIEGVILESREHPRPLHRLRVPTEAHLGYTHILSQLQRLTALLEEELGLKPKRLGIGHPGTLDPRTGQVKNANTTALNGRPFNKDLEALLGIPVRLANDANCFAAAEALAGAVPNVLPDAEVVFGIIMGTGVGGGWVIHGKVINGRQGIGASGDTTFWMRAEAPAIVAGRAAWKRLSPARPCKNFTPCKQGKTFPCMILCYGHKLPPILPLWPPWIG